MVVSKEKILLEERRCACGCNNNFKVFKTSTQIYANQFCREFHLKIPRKQLMREYFSQNKSRGRPKSKVE